MVLLKLFLVLGVPSRIMNWEEDYDDDDVEEKEEEGYIGPSQPARMGQKWTLANYMFRHSNFCQRKFHKDMGLKEYQNIWKSLVDFLNSAEGGSKKDLMQWQNVPLTLQ